MTSKLINSKKIQINKVDNKKKDNKILKNLYYLYKIILKLVRILLNNYNNNSMFLIKI